MIRNLEKITDMLPGHFRATSGLKNYKRIFDPDAFIHSGSQIVHYTDLNGLKGIIEEKGFWLSDHRFLNDNEEYENGRRITVDVLSRLLERARHSRFRRILRLTIEGLLEHKENPQYVCSFSTQAESLSQWRSYARDGRGVSLIFQNPGLGNSPFILMPHMTLKKVEYSDRRKVTSLVRKIHLHAKEHERDLITGIEIEEDTWAKAIVSHLSLDFITYKNTAYESEGEVRIEATNVRGHAPLHHRVSGEKIIPYIKTKEIFTSADGTDHRPELGLVAVKVGPAASQDVTIKSIRSFLDSMGYSHVHVEKSSIPYRG